MQYVIFVCSAGLLRMGTQPIYEFGPCLFSIVGLQCSLPHFPPLLCFSLTTTLQGRLRESNLPKVKVRIQPTHYPVLLIGSRYSFQGHMVSMLWGGSVYCKDASAVQYCLPDTAAHITCEKVLNLWMLSSSFLQDHTYLPVVRRRLHMLRHVTDRSLFKPLKLSITLSPYVSISSEHFQMSLREGKEHFWLSRHSESGEYSVQVPLSSLSLDHLRLEVPDEKRNQ